MIKVILKKNQNLAVPKPETEKQSGDENLGSATALGKFLRASRKNKGLTQTRLSELTRIPLWHLQALEEGQYENLPPEVYLRGVFGRLAKFLDLSLKDIFEKYLEDNPAPKAVESLPPESPGRFSNYFFTITPKKIAFGASALFLVLIFTYLWYQYDVFTGPPSLVLINPKQDAEVLAPDFKIQGYTDSDSYLTINGQDVYVNQDGTFNSNLTLTAGLNAIEIKAKNRLGKESRVIRQIFYKTNSKMPVESLEKINNKN